MIKGNSEFWNKITSHKLDTISKDNENLFDNEIIMKDSRENSVNILNKSMGKIDFQSN